MSTNSRPTPRRKYDNSRRRAEAGARQRRIVDAATKLFVAQGFGGTSIDRIAVAAEVSSPTVYATFGSKAGVLARAIDVAVAGDYEDTPMADRLLSLIGESGTADSGRFRAVAQFVRRLNERVAPLFRIMEHAASTDPTLQQMRAERLCALRADCAVAVEKVWRDALRPGLSRAEAADVTATMVSPQTYSMLTVDMGWSPARYQKWLGDALPRLILRPELLAN